MALVRSGAAATPGSGEGSGGFRCRRLMKFQRVPVQIANKVPEGSDADGWWSFERCGADKVLEGSGWLMTDEVRRVPAQIADRVAGVFSAYSRQSSGGFWYKNLPRSSKLLGITHEFILMEFKTNARLEDFLLHVKSCQYVHTLQRFFRPSWIKFHGGVWTRLKNLCGEWFSFLL